MYQIAQAVLWGWVPLVLVLFVIMPPRRAVVIALIGSWLFLPQLAYSVPLMPDFSRVTATSYGIILGALILDPKSRVLNFTPKLIDIPMAVFVISPFFSSITNDLGIYDGASAVVHKAIAHGLPYLIGRLYFQTPEDAKEFAMGVLIGGLLYVPLCLYEIRMSPQLHEMIYGFRSITDWQQVKRWDGWRPMVFMRHGLMVGVWMTTTAAMAFWLWRTKAVKKIFGVPMGLIAMLTLITAVLCKSTGAVGLFLVLMVSMLAVRYLGTKVLLYTIVCGVPVYLILRVTGLFTGETVSENMAAVFPFLEDRVSSLQYRLDHENAIVGRTLEKPLLGWGGWGDAFQVYLPKYNSRAVPDSLWVGTFGDGGIIGLTAMFAYKLIPPFLLLTKMKPKEWCDPRYAPITGLAMIIMLYVMDCMLNAMENPVFIVAVGAVATLATNISRTPVKSTQPLNTGSSLPSSGDLEDEADDGLDSDEPLILVDPPIDRDRPLGGAT
ncbi:MAG: O-antigen ligase domain-containing protein [Planctomycetota bacterium]